MTVKDLIQQLSDMPQEMVVVVEGVEVTLVRKIIDTNDYADNPREVIDIV